MIARTVKGPVFTILVDGKAIVVQHVASKGRRCRITAPNGVRIVTGCADDDEIRRSENNSCGDAGTNDEFDVDEAAA